MLAKARTGPPAAFDGARTDAKPALGPPGIDLLLS
jgi:hypothetical protein